LTETTLRLVFGLGSPVLILTDKGESEGGFGYIPSPDQDVRRFFARNKINHFSMRSDDISATKSPGHLRVLFIGDSVTYGTTYIDQSRIFTSLLAHEMPKLVGRPVDVLNASAGGWGPANEVGFLQSRGNFDADLVLIVLNTADLRQPFADLPRDPGFPTEAPLTAIGEMWTRYIAPRLFAARGETDPGSVSSPADGIFQETSATLATLEAGRAYSVAHNSRFGIVYIPSHSKLWDNVDFHQGKKMLVDWARSNSVPLIDLSLDIDGHSFDQIYVDRGEDHIHLAPYGHGVVATRLLSDIPPILDFRETPSR
jgi:lysophospholipase L1-like esterase